MGNSICHARLVQFNPRLGGVTHNLERHLALIQEAAAAGRDLVIFPELSLTGYYLRDLAPEVSLSLDSAPLRALAEASRHISVVVGFVEETPSSDLYCSAAFFSGGELRHLHRKVYLPTYGMFDEGRYLSAGASLETFPTPWGPMGLLICEDLWHPSAPFVLSRRGMDFLISINASPLRGVEPGGPAIATAYQQMVGTYANLFQCFVLFCNRVGVEDGVTFWGGSRAVSPLTGELAVAPLLEETHLDVDLDREHLRMSRVASPLLADERLDLTLRALEKIADE
ncbi:MAG TPA: nitrilase-related carbon-nitrogen hydrolase [Armatimonadota bacterium]|jgi:predicted amidohydrolase